MPLERAADHPMFELGNLSITSFVAPARGGFECALYRVDVPASEGLPPHHHDHLDVFMVLAGSGSFHLGDESFEMEPGDSMVVPIGVRHYLEAGPDGAELMVAMLAGTKMIRDDGSEAVPPWVS
jgi:quercetin dioxygenase-like cupin family protein